MPGTVLSAEGIGTLKEAVNFTVCVGPPRNKSKLEQVAAAISRKSERGATEPRSGRNLHKGMVEKELLDRSGEDKEK